MPTTIDQERDPSRRVTTLRIRGEMFRDDACLIEKIASSIRDETGDGIVIDLADLDLLDGEAASILRRIAESPRSRIEGIEIFLQSMIDDAERRDP